MTEQEGCYLCQPDNPSAADEGCAACEREFWAWAVPVALALHECDWTLRPESDTWVCELCGAER